MRSVRLLAAMVAIGASAVTVGCGQRHGTGSGTSAADPSAPASASSAPRAGCHGTIPVAPGHTFILGNGDDGKAFCVTRGAALLLILRGGPGRTWAPVHASPGVLNLRPDGRLMLARWVTGASFTAVRPGTAVLSSMRPTCRGSASSGARSSAPATMPCAAELAFRVTIVVGK